MGPEALNINGFHSFFFEIFMPYSWYFFVKNPLKSPDKAMKNVNFTGFSCVFIS